MWAHPRSRGEHTCFLGARAYGLGSSPLTRGAPTDLIDRATADRLIPAHAGSTLATRRRSAMRGAHPRSRGEHVCGFVTLVVRMGSSPLTRGARVCGFVSTAVARLIPAHAGSTPDSGRDQSKPWAHPRSRGEHSLHRPVHLQSGGSSPLTRGARTMLPPFGGVSGLIPAHAGSTNGRTVTKSFDTAHPRSRGEHSYLGHASRHTTGSSPLTRGARTPPPHRPHARRLIPAHAGSTFVFAHGFADPRAHPRSRGEHSGTIASGSIHGGSSPLTRGAPIICVLN